MRSLRNHLVLFAYTYRGRPYIYGGNNPNLGTDCSGFVCWVLREFNLIDKHDYSAQMLYDLFTGRKSWVNGEWVAIPGGVDCATQELKPGNLLFFGGDPDRVCHVSIVVDRIWMIEAARGNSRTKTLGMAIAQNAIIDISQISRRTDRVCIVNPFSKGA